VATDGHTKMLQVLLGEKKKYQGVISFNQTSETLDPESEIIKNKDRVELTEDDVRIMSQKKFLGLIKQEPPKYSSIKINGKKAYDLARKGIEFKLEPVERKIYEFKIKHLKDDNY
jgi:tRNA pseudouridine55 synthase